MFLNCKKNGQSKGKQEKMGLEKGERGRKERKKKRKGATEWREGAGEIREVNTSAPQLRLIEVTPASHDTLLDNKIRDQKNIF